MTSQAPMGISLSNMSKTAMAGMAFALGSFFSFLIGVAALQLVCGFFSIIFGIIGAIIGGVVLRTEKPRAMVILIFSLMGIIMSFLVIAYFYA